MSEVILWTDGSCHPNPGGPGGYAFRCERNGRVFHEDSGGEVTSTNNRMEMMAALAGLQFLAGLQPEIFHVEVRSDSSYLVNCFRQRWYVKWKRNNWISSTGSPVSNRDLWEKLLDVCFARHLTVVFIHVKGHAGVEHNEWCDRMAGIARERANGVWASIQEGR